MFCIGGPFAGKDVPMKFDHTQQSVKVPREADWGKSACDMQMDILTLELTHEMYHVEYLLFSWGGCGELRAWALVHESVTDEMDKRRAVLQCMIAAALNHSFLSF